MEGLKRCMREYAHSPHQFHQIGKVELADCAGRRRFSPRTIWWNTKLGMAFVAHLPFLPIAVWRDRDYLAMTLFGRPLGKKARAAYAEHLEDLEAWRKNLES